MNFNFMNETLNFMNEINFSLNFFLSMTDDCCNRPTYMLANSMDV